MKRKMWRLVRSLRYYWYKIRYGIIVDLEHTLYPIYGRGKYVSVFRKGDYIDIVAHSRPKSSLGTIRLIPYQPNHGIMVEFIDTHGKGHWRILCDYDKFYSMGAISNEFSEK